MALPRFLSNISVDTKTRKMAAVGAGLALLTLVLGIWFGFMAGKSAAKTSCYLTKALRNRCARTPWSRKRTEASKYFSRSVRAFNEQVCLPKAGSCHQDRLPRNYIAYHLNGKTITIDGRDLDPAWTEVPWSQTFIDMRGTQYPKPRLDTKFKIRWDDSKMYVFIYVQEADLFGTHAINDSNVWKDNGIEMLMDVDGSMWYYKQVQVNVLGAIYDIMSYTKTALRYKQVQVNVLGAIHDIMFAQNPYDAGGWQIGNVWFRSWSSNVQHAIYKSGTINDPSDRDKYWSAELALDWAALAQNSSRLTPQPKDNEVWFMQFGRSEWKLNVTNNTYVKAKTKGEWMSEDWWSWQSCRTVNLHLQDRWGLVQFKKNRRDRRFLSTQWHVYKALFDVHDGMTSYKALNKRFTESIYDLTIPTSLLSRVCVEIPTISLYMRNGTQDFNVTVTSRLLKDSPTAHIRGDRFVWFD